MLSDNILAHLRSEMSAEDPWRLGNNEYERRRYAAMIRMIGEDSIFDKGLEVGCAIGVFSSRLVERCRKLHIIDVLPEALERTRSRLGENPDVTYRLASVDGYEGAKDGYDLIVAAEVFYYLNDKALIAAAIGNLARMLRPGGTVICSSAPESVTWRWLMPYGAETVMAEWSKHATEMERETCLGAIPDEHAIVTRYRK